MSPSFPPHQKNPSLYKHSLPKFSLKPGQWYADRLVGINFLKKTVKTLAEKGGLEGYFTNHSLRLSCVTRMYAAGVDEQLIMETTGHKSECVHQYKRTSEDLLHVAQETVSHLPPSKKVRKDPVTSSTVSAPSDGFSPDIIEVDENEWFDSNVLNQQDETVLYVVNEEGKKCRAHKNPCAVAQKSGSCNKMCTVLQKVDKKTEELKKKCARLSLKFVKSKRSK